jgi:hypothetical protein
MYCRQLQLTPYQLQSADTRTRLDEDNLEPFFYLKTSLRLDFRPVRQVCFKVGYQKV